MTEGLADEVVGVLQSRTPAVLVTVVASTGAAGFPIGLKAIFHAGGRTDPELPPGLLADAILRDSRLALASGERRLELYSPDGDAADRRATERVQVFMEPLAPADRLIIVGAGHIAIPICRIAAVLGFEVTVLDDRSDYANQERFPEATEVIAADIGASLADLTIDGSTYIILVTRAHVFDEEALERIATSKARYIGMIGSRRRVLIVHRNLLDKGVPPESLGKVHAPLGIDIGSETVEEIALAAVAEVVNVKRGGRAPSLRIDVWQESSRPSAAEGD